MPRRKHPYDAIPELAGVATYQSAARVGLSVTDNVQLLLRYHWSERRLMQLLVENIPAMPIWEVKCAMALHQWQCAEHVNALRNRIAEMRNPVPNLDVEPETDGGHEGGHKGGHEFVRAIYGVAFPALAKAYRTHLAKTNPLVAYPPRPILQF